MVIEFLILIGVFAMTLDQVRRLRTLNAQQKAYYEALIAALESQLAAANDPTIQAELDAFEADLTPAKPAEETPAA